MFGCTYQRGPNAAAGSINRDQSQKGSKYVLACTVFQYFSRLKFADCSLASIETNLYADVIRIALHQRRFLSWDSLHGLWPDHSTTQRNKKEYQPASVKRDDYLIQNNPNKMNRKRIPEACLDGMFEWFRTQHVTACTLYLNTLTHCMCHLHRIHNMYWVMYTWNHNVCLCACVRAYICIHILFSRCSFFPPINLITSRSTLFIPGRWFAGSWCARWVLFKVALAGLTAVWLSCLEAIANDPACRIEPAGTEGVLVQLTAALL